VSSEQIDDSAYNFKPIGESAARIVEKAAAAAYHRRRKAEMTAIADKIVESVSEHDSLAGDLMRAIAGAMTCRQPKLALIMLGAQTSVALRNHAVRLAREPAKLRPLGWDE
jgi:hypothetical protein